MLQFKAAAIAVSVRGDGDSDSQLWEIRRICTYMFFNIRTMSSSLVTFFSDAQLFALDVHICTASWFLMLLSRPIRENVLGPFSCDCTYSKRVQILARASVVNTNSNARSQSIIRVHPEIT
ncbi:hypothetical protein Ddc_17570 [Ditylenchus destructor]|nr:hypothetical protein Ddc_17570 [Ditylenchus destructor]